MSSPQQEISVLQPDARIELFEIDLSPIGNPAILRFCNSKIGLPLSLAGAEYKPWAIKVSNYGSSTDGALPTPSVTLSNYKGVVSSLLDLYRPQGAIFRRRLILRRNLDDGGDPRPEAQFLPDEFTVDRWGENRRFVTLFLESALAYLNTEIPGRRIISLRTGP